MHDHWSSCQGSFSRPSFCFQHQGEGMPCACGCGTEKLDPHCQPDSWLGIGYPRDTREFSRKLKRSCFVGDYGMMVPQGRHHTRWAIEWHSSSIFVGFYSISPESVPRSPAAIIYNSTFIKEASKYFGVKDRRSATNLPFFQQQLRRSKSFLCQDLRSVT